MPRTGESCRRSRRDSLPAAWPARFGRTRRARRPIACWRRAMRSAERCDATEKSKRTPSEMEEVRNARERWSTTKSWPRLERHQSSPEELNLWRERGSSPGSGPPRSPSRLFSQWRCEGACSTARYSGGAASALNRLPCPAFAINCTSKLRQSILRRKRAGRSAAYRVREDPDHLLHGATRVTEPSGVGNQTVPRE
jgi:hypothetical protein